jgi:flagellar assembly protein FliH
MSRPPIRNVPPPPGSKAGNAYTRFIPREELQGFEAWNPDSFGDAATPASPDAPQADAPEADWPAQVLAARQSGYHDGYRDGLVALESFKQSFAAQATAQVGQLVESLDREFEALESRLAQAVAETAMRLARQVLRSELRTQPECVARVAAEAVNAVLLSARQLVLHLHPEDLPLVAEGAADLLAARGARLVPDEAITRGGCRVESDLGAVDAAIERRWAAAAGALADDPAGRDWNASDDAA